MTKAIGKISKKEKWIFLFIIFVIGLIVNFTWFKEGQIIAGQDYLPPLIPFKAIYNSLFSWDVQGGEAFLSLTRLFPDYSFWALFKLMGFSLLTIQRFWFLFILLFPGFAMYYCVSVLLPGNRYLIARIIAPVFYILNLFVITSINTCNSVYLLAPLMLGFFVKGLETKDNRYVFLFGISSLFFSNSATSPTLYALGWSIIVAYLIYHIIFHEGQKRGDVLYFVKVISIYVLINMWWIVSFIIPFLNKANLVEGIIQGFGGLDYVIRWSTDSSFLNLFRLLGKWSWGTGFSDGTPYFQYAPSYSKPFLLITTILIPVLAYSALFFCRKNKQILFFVGLSIISIFLTKGMHPPFEFINEWLYRNVPGFLLFREPQTKFPLVTVFCFSVLLGISVNEIYIYLSKLKDRVVIIFSRVFLIFFIILIISISGWPILTGDIIIQDRGKYLDYYITIPSYWLNAGEWLNNLKRAHKVLLSPQSSEYTIFSWGYSGANIARRLVYQSRWPTMPLLQDSDLLDDIYTAITRGPSTNLVRLLGFLGTDRILQRNDILTAKDVSSAKDVKLILDSTDGIFLEKSLGELDVYKVTSTHSLPYIYIPQNLVISKNKMNVFFQIIFLPDYKIGSAVYFKELNTENIQKIGQLPNIVEGTTVLEFRKINLTKYFIKVHQAKNSFPLVFSESFHKGWKVYAVSASDRPSLRVQNLDSYQILDGNKNDQANKEEAEEFISRGWVSSLGDGIEKQIEHKKYENGQEKLDYIEKYSIDFISKNFQGTIQNDNLPKGKFYETWLAGKLGEQKNGIVQGILRFAQNDNVKQLTEENHLTANGYANSWLIETDKICSQNDFCVKNPDGTYDFELIVEFWPQRLFYIGLLISSFTLFGCVGYMVYGILRRRKREKEAVKLGKNF